MQLPDPYLVNYWRLADNRIYYINDEINEETLEIQKDIITINIEDRDKKVEDRKPIIILINSPGGYLQETMSVAQSMIMSRTPVITVNIGSAYSGGSLLLMAGHKRYAFKYSKAMVHSGGTSGMAGTYEQTEAAQKIYKKQIDEMGKYILERTNIPETLFKKNKTKDWYMDHDEQVKYGLVDSIIESLDEII